MKPAYRRLPAFAALLVPLGVLAWLGSAELGWQTERAERALTGQARDFVREAKREFETVLTATERVLDHEPLDLGRHYAAAAARSMREGDPAILDLVILDAEGALLFPRAAPREIDSLPFQRASFSGTVRRAEALELLGDLEGARGLLEGLLDRQTDETSRFPTRENIALRAHFELAGVLRRLGDLDGAEEHYLLASIEAAGESRRSVTDAARATVALWSEVALAEIDSARARGQDRAVELAQAIADGVHDAVAEPMLLAVLERLEELCADDVVAQSRVLEARADDSIRRDGRAFAAEYGAFLRESVRRRVERVPAGAEPVRIVHATRSGTSVLVLRPTREAERSATLDELEGAAWIGLRIDLDQVLAESLAERLATDVGPFVLVVSDPDGIAIAPPPETAPTSEPRAWDTTEAGLRLSAVPLDPDALLADRGRTIRNRALLIVLLCVVAGGGAFFLVRSVERESELAELKVALVSRMTHDLKTPLALIRMYAETIGRGRARTPEETTRFAGIVQREADALTRMVERVLDFSRSEAGTLTYSPRPFALDEALATLVDAFRPHAEARRIELRAELPDDPVIGCVDPGAFESSVLDLLENAVKYTPAETESPEIVVRLRRDGDRAVVEVDDRGAGIPTGEHEKVFESFYRGTNAGEARGAGLGLALVRHFAAAHGGTATAAPRDGGGTRVRVELPLHDDVPTEADVGPARVGPEPDRVEERRTHAT